MFALKICKVYPSKKWNICFRGPCIMGPDTMSQHVLLSAGGVGEGSKENVVPSPTRDYRAKLPRRNDI